MGIHDLGIRHRDCNRHRVPIASYTLSRTAILRLARLIRHVPGAAINSMDQTLAIQ